MCHLIIWPRRTRNAGNLNGKSSHQNQDLAKNWKKTIVQYVSNKKLHRKNATTKTKILPKAGKKKHFSILFSLKFEEKKAATKTKILLEIQKFPCVPSYHLTAPGKKCRECKSWKKCVFNTFTIKIWIEKATANTKILPKAETIIFQYVSNKKLKRKTLPPKTKILPRLNKTIFPILF